jgi:hypothetical protein
VYENVSGTVIRLDESETFVGIVELHCAVRHDDVLSLTVCTWEWTAQFRGLSRCSNLERG